MRYTGDWDKDHQALSPEIVASVYTQHLDEQRFLANKARTLYRVNKSWGKKITDTNKGRKLLNVFIKHWFDSYIQTGRMGS